MMDINKMVCKALREKPETKRASRKMEKPIDFTMVTGMGLNENVFGMSPKAKEAMDAATVQSNRYGDFQAYYLKKAIADSFNLSIENVITAAGSSAIIDTIGYAFLEEGDELITCMPTFHAFADTAYEQLATPVFVDLTEDHRFNLNGILDHINEKTKMIVICNPNNPTGTYISEKELEAFFQQIPENIVVVMDEAYIEFATAGDCVSAVELMKAYMEKPIIVLRTFSKYYGLAGVRVGYALAAKEIVAQIMRCSGVWSLSKAAQAGAVEAIQDTKHCAYVKEKVAESREYLMKELKDLGCEVFDSQTNFIYFNTHKNTSFVFNSLLELGIHTSGGHQYNRVTVGTMSECEYFISLLKKVLA